MHVYIYRHVPSYARLGAVNYLSTNTTDSGPIDYEIVQVKIHPNYTVGATFNDIALLRLSKDVDFSAHVRPICLNTDRSLNIKHALATGWGQTSYSQSRGARINNILSSYDDQFLTETVTRDVYCRRADQCGFVESRFEHYSGGTMRSDALGRIVQSFS